MEMFQEVGNNHSATTRAPVKSHKIYECNSNHRTNLEMHQYVHDVVVYFRGDPSLRLVGKQDVLNSQKRHQDEGGSHGFHVETRLCLMSHLQLGDEHSHDVQEKEQIDLRGTNKRTSVNQHNNFGNSCFYQVKCFLRLRYKLFLSAIFPIIFMFLLFLVSSRLFPCFNVQDVHPESEHSILVPVSLKGA